jgi:LacI family transcriptional regulator
VTDAAPLDTPARGRSHGATIRDIADELGISHSTVSRALADHPRVNRATRESVLRVARRLGYVANASARTMRSARSPLVGFVIPDIQNDFYASVAKRVADALAAHGLRLVLSVTEDDPDREMRDVRALVEARCAGVIVTPTPTPRPETRDMLARVRTIQLVRRVDGLDADAVTIDDAAGTRAAAAHLVGCGHRTIAYVGTSAHMSSGRARLAGFRAALADAGLDPSLAWLGPPRPEFGRHAAARLLNHAPRPTALVLGSSELTLGALQALRAVRVPVPGGLSLVGYGDPAWFGLVDDGITTVHLPVDEVAAAVTELVLDDARPTGPAARPPALAVPTLRPALVLRGSTRPLVAP